MEFIKFLIDLLFPKPPEMHATISFDVGDAAVTSQELAQAASAILRAEDSPVRAMSSRMMNGDWDGAPKRIRVDPATDPADHPAITVKVTLPTDFTHQQIFELERLITHNLLDKLTDPSTRNHPHGQTP